MDYTQFLSTIDFSTFGYVALMTFGAVAGVNIVYKKRTDKELESDVKLALSVVFAIIFGFIPADLGSLILNKFRDGLSIAVMLNGAYQALSGIGKKFAGTAV